MSAQYYRPQRENRGRSRLWYVTFLVIIVFLLDLVAGGRLRAAIRTSASYIYISMTHAGSAIGITEYLTSHAALEKENAELKRQLSAYHAKDASYVSIQKENAELRTLTGFAARTPGKTASVVSAPSASPYGTFLIDLGTSGGITRGSVVYAQDGYAIGIISDIGGSTSLVSEILAPNSSIEATIGDAVVVMQGEGGGNGRAQAPRDADIKVGDVVHAPQVGAPIALVEKVEAAPTGAYKQVYARIPDNISTLSIVYVARK